MNILFGVRSDYLSFPGGDIAQMNFTRQALLGLGCSVEITTNPNISYSNYDSVHLWHLERCHETYPFFIRAKESGKRIFLNPTYWPFDHRPFVNKKNIRGLKENLKLVIRYFLAKEPIQRKLIGSVLKIGWLKCRETMLNESDVLLPNSKSEAEILRQEASKPIQMEVVSNVIDLKHCDAFERLPWNKREKVLCVGHFCPRKNQLRLIEALPKSDTKVIFVGGYRPMHKYYFEKCRKVAGDKHQFLGTCDNDMILKLMGQSKVHIMTSYSETPGIVNLEAAYMGCQLVLPPIPPIKDYFGQMGIYFTNDYSDTGLRDALEKALNTDPGDKLREHVQERFSIDALKKRLSEFYFE